MTDFNAALLALIGDATDAWDIKAVVRRCFFFDFDGYPVRLWAGQGTMTSTANVGAAWGGNAANEWLGTIDAQGQDHLIAPPVTDDRDGTAPLYEFTLPWLDANTYAAIKADQALARGRDLICYRALFAAGEGLRPQTPIQFAWKMEMRGTRFTDAMDLDGQGQTTRARSATVIARSLEYGRSRVPSGTYCDTAQNERARLLGLDSDSGCSFVAANATRTIVVGG
jgi:hypothetical protein